MQSERQYFEELRDKVFAEAKAKGLEIVIAGSNQLQLDLDHPWTLDVNLTTNPQLICKVIHNHQKKASQVLDRFLTEIEILSFQAWKSTNGNCHVALTLYQEFDVEKRIALQTILGSDPMREFLNLRRVLCGADDPIALFKPSETKS